VEKISSLVNSLQNSFFFLFFVFLFFRHFRAKLYHFALLLFSLSDGDDFTLFLQSFVQSSSTQKGTKRARAIKNWLESIAACREPEQMLLLSMLSG
jgi:hypothetical protein